MQTEEQRIKDNARAKAWRLAHPERVKELRNRWRQANPERDAEKRKLWDSQHSDKITETKKRWLTNHPDKRKAVVTKYKNANREKLLAQNRQYIANKRKEDPEGQKAYEKAWRKSNLAYRIRKSLRGRIYDAITKGVGSHGRKCDKTMMLIGCSVDALKQHLESLFKPGMTWDNWGVRGWHIDHIRPCASFDLSDPEQQKQCFHWSNLQPMWWRDNIVKGAKLESTSRSQASTQGVNHHLDCDDNGSPPLGLKH